MFRSFLVLRVVSRTALSLFDTLRRQRLPSKLRSRVHTAQKIKLRKSFQDFVLKN